MEHLQEAVLLEMNLLSTTIRCDWLSSVLYMSIITEIL